MSLLDLAESERTLLIERECTEPEKLIGNPVTYAVFFENENIDFDCPHRNQHNTTQCIASGNNCVVADKQEYLGNVIPIRLT